MSLVKCPECLRLCFSDSVARLELFAEVVISDRLPYREPAHRLQLPL
jgi:hypothetical protein